MRAAHDPVDAWGMAGPAKSPHVRPVVNRNGNTHMFVRAVWRLKRLVDLKQTLREMDVPTTRDALGLTGKDFDKMTRGLFDRP
jgi:hypothetical protein